MLNSTQKKNGSRKKNGDKGGKASHKLMKNAIYKKTVENLRKRIEGHQNQAICHKKYLKIIWWQSVKTTLH